MSCNPESAITDFGLHFPKWLALGRRVRLSRPGKTALPDFGTITINYVPDKYIVELKSLKLYIVKFRYIGIFHEHVTNKIMDDIVKACKPKKIDITGDFHPRGGIKTVVRSEK